MRQVDGYIRVSDVAGRISVKEQRRAIEAYAAAHGLQIAERDEDLNESGGTWERPAFQAALGRCRHEHTSGVIAAKLDRLTRSTVGLGNLIDEARAGVSHFSASIARQFRAWSSASRPHSSH
jgi:DNA invertase Pin-like site-specific DNA recombinase